MKEKKRSLWVLLSIACVVGLVALFAISCTQPEKAAKESQAIFNEMICPGQLSKAHAFLEKDCSACHTPNKGIEASKCIVCHANNEALLKRQPTAFHSDISTCSACHVEHLGRRNRPTKMSHEALAKAGIQMLKSNDDKESEIYVIGKKLDRWVKANLGGKKQHSAHASLTPAEKTLNCAACHKNEDVHLGMFGKDCAACHSSGMWTIAEFKHPRPSSMDCSQCHQAPPSHYMNHFKMISQKVACQPNARVDQCYKCHLTTSWNDIRDVGWYKHH
ncbi:MAG: cytochrome c3 family protein [Candidatus Obscuribacterales bacterium]|nr:cytochrome c3 family protein [Candidatus Obscuribacterales bacterium]